MAVSCPHCFSADTVASHSQECEYSCLACGRVFSKAEFEAGKKARAVADPVVVEARPTIRRGKKAS